MGPASGHGALTHRALLHRGPDDLAGRMAEPLARAVGRGHAVLVSLAPEAWDPLRVALGPAEAGVRWLHADDRYATPAGAMVTLHRFVTDAVAAGAPTVWSLGALDLDGSEGDERWIRYEHAVDEVLGPLPLQAVCAYDVDATPPAALAHAVAAHPLVTGAVEAAPARPSAGLAPPPAVAVRERLVDEVVDTAAGGRAAVDAVAARVAAPVLDDLRLVVSELVTNGLRHGRPPVRLQVGLALEGVVTTVADAGPGIDDPYMELRPPRPEGDGGRGLNIVAQLGGLTVAHDGAGATVTSVLALPPS